MTSMKATLEPSSTQFTTNPIMDSQTPPVSWTTWSSTPQTGLHGWSQRLVHAWEEERFDDAMVEIDEYMDRIVPFVNDVLRAVGLCGQANCHLGMGRYKEALDCIEQVEGILSNHASTIGDLADNRADIDEANRFFTQYKAMLLLNLGREEEAIQMLRANPPTHSLVRDIYRKIENKLGIELFDSNIDSTSSSSCSTCTSTEELTGTTKALYEKLIGEWLAKERN
jgi:tetratricopeptide (TPR) repeat protein